MHLCQTTSHGIFPPTVHSLTTWFSDIFSNMPPLSTLQRGQRSRGPGARTAPTKSSRTELCQSCRKWRGSGRRGRGKRNAQLFFVSLAAPIEPKGQVSAEEAPISTPLLNISFEVIFYCSVAKSSRILSLLNTVTVLLFF